jgi:hypothetical protein
LADAVWTVRRKLIRKNVLALLYVLYGDGRATLGAPERSNLS